MTDPNEKDSGMIDDPVETDRVPPLCPYDFSFAAFLIEPEPEA